MMSCGLRFMKHIIVSYPILEVLGVHSAPATGWASHLLDIFTSINKGEKLSKLILSYCTSTFISRIIEFLVEISSSSVDEPSAGFINRRTKWLLRAAKFRAGKIEKTKVSQKNIVSAGRGGQENTYE